MARLSKRREMELTPLLVSVVTTTLADTLPGQAPTGK